MSTHPFPVMLADSTRQRAYNRLRDTRCPSEEFHFRITLPRSWRALDLEQVPPSLEQVGRLALYVQPGTPGAEVEVSVHLLPREVAPALWLGVLLDQLGEVVLEDRTVATSAGAVSDVLTRRSVDAQEVVSRWHAIKDGDHMFCLHARCLEQRYPRLAEAFMMAVSSFELLHPGESPVAENMRSFSLREPGDFCLFYPDSWTLAADPTSNPEAVQVHLRNLQEGELLGQNSVAVVARSAEDAPARLAGHYIEALAGGGMELPALDLTRITDLGGFDGTWQDRLLGRARGGSADALEVWVTVGRRPDAWFLLTHHGPSRSAAPALWAVNHRAYQLLLEWFRTPGNIEG